MNILLNEAEARVLGSLVEKEITTPDYYPLSLNALMNACNQKSNRDPLMNLKEDAVRQSLHGLSEKGLAGPVNASDSRVTKYQHRLEIFNFSRREAAIFCVLLLRGPQTPGELRGRAERMHRFEELADVQSTLQHLMKRDPPLVKMLPRQSGTKESRYVHLLLGDLESWNMPEDSGEPSPVDSVEGERVARLEDQLTELKNEVADLKQQFMEFRKQFQ